MLMGESSGDVRKSIDEIKSDVIEAISQDVKGAEFCLGIFSAAILSYRKSSCLKPCPDIFDDVPTVDTESNLETLSSIFSTIPPLKELQETVLSDDAWKLLFWILKNKRVKVKQSDRNTLGDIFLKTGESSFTLQPCEIYEISYMTRASERFNELKKKYGLKYGYHGSRLDNFYSIINNGLQVHMMKNGLFGEGVYLTDDLSVTMPYTKPGVIWKHSELGEQVSCVAVCELIDHPDVKCQVQNDTSRTRATAKNSESGEVPERYYVVTSSELVRVKYILMFSQKKINKRSFNKRARICSQYPVLTILVLYLLFLLLMGIWKSRSFQLYYRRYFFQNDEDSHDS